MQFIFNFIHSEYFSQSQTPKLATELNIFEYKLENEHEGILEKIPVTPNLPIPSIYSSIAFPDNAFIMHPMETVTNYFLDLHVSQYLQSLIPIKLESESNLISTINQTQAFREHPWSVIVLKEKIQNIIGNVLQIGDYID